MNLITWAVWGVIVITLFAIVSNTSQTAITNINDQFAKLNCPTPLYNYVDFGNGTIINSDLTKNSGKLYGSVYQCFYDPHSVPAGTHITVSYVAFNHTDFNAFPSGWFSYVGQMFSAYMYKLGAIENLIAYILTPINFNILGYTLASVSGVVLMVIIAIYILCYIPVAILAYKALSPWVSLG